MLELLGRETTREEIRRYQAEELGRRGKDTFLLELMPLPKPSIGAWGYEGLLPQFDSREDYYDQVLPERATHIRHLLNRHSPAAVIGYGKSCWPHYRKLFPDVRYSEEGPYQIAAGEPFVLLSHHFTSRTMNGRFAEMAEKIRSAFETASA